MGSTGFNGVFRFFINNQKVVRVGLLPIGKENDPKAMVSIIKNGQKDRKIPKPGKGGDPYITVKVDDSLVAAYSGELRGKLPVHYQNAISMDTLQQIVHKSTEVHEQQHAADLRECPLAGFGQLGQSPIPGNMTAKQKEYQIIREARATIEEMKTFESLVKKEVGKLKLDKDSKTAIIATLIDAQKAIQARSKIRGTNMTYAQAVDYYNQKYAQKDGKKLSKRDQDKAMIAVYMEFYSAVTSYLESYLKEQKLDPEHQDVTLVSAPDGRAVCHPCWMGDTMPTCSEFWCPNYGDCCSKYRGKKQPGDYDYLFWRSHHEK